MAVWHLAISMVPEGGLWRVYGEIPSFLVEYCSVTLDTDFDEIPSHNYWEGIDVFKDFVPEAKVVLADEFGRAADHVRLGSRDGDRFYIWEEEVQFEWDLRDANIEVLEAFLRLARKFECKLVDRKGRVIAPEMLPVIEMVKSSGAYKFVRDPQGWAAEIAAREDGKSSFEKLIRESFDFLESERHMKFSGVRSVGGSDPRDAGLVARYSRDEFRLDVGWSKSQCSLTISVKFEGGGIPRGFRHIYFEPFVEFLTGGREKAIVPYIREGMSVREILSISSEREVVFKGGLPVVVKALGEKLRLYFNQIESASVEMIDKYHDWMAVTELG